MIAIEEMLPPETDEQREIQRILCEQPDLQVMIKKAQAQAGEKSPRPRFVLEPVRYGDEWDLPMQLIVMSDVGRDDYRRFLLEFKRWLVEELHYDSDRILITAQPSVASLDSDDFRA